MNAPSDQVVGSRLPIWAQASAPPGWDSVPLRRGRFEPTSGDGVGGECPTVGTGDAGLWLSVLTVWLNGPLGGASISLDQVEHVSAATLESKPANATHCRGRRWRSVQG